MENNELKNKIEEKPKKKDVKKEKKSSKKKSIAKTTKSKSKKYRLTFLKNQMFRGEFYKKDENIIVPESIAKAYSKRPNLRFDAF